MSASNVERVFFRIFVRLSHGLDSSCSQRTQGIVRYGLLAYTLLLVALLTYLHFEYVPETTRGKELERLMRLAADGGRNAHVLEIAIVQAGAPLRFRASNTADWAVWREAQAKPDAPASFPALTEAMDRAVLAFGWANAQFRGWAMADVALRHAAGELLPFGGPLSLVLEELGRKASARGSEAESGGDAVNHEESPQPHAGLPRQRRATVFQFARERGLLFLVEAGGVETLGEHEEHSKKKQKHQDSEEKEDLGMANDCDKVDGLGKDGVVGQGPGRGCGASAGAAQQPGSTNKPTESQRTRDAGLRGGLPLLARLEVPEDDEVFGPAAARALLRVCGGVDAAMASAAQRAFGGVGFLRSVDSARVFALGKGQDVRKLRGQWVSWAVFKVGTLLSALFVIFAAMGLTSFVFAETQRRMVRFTLALGHAVQSRRPVLRLVLAHSLDSLMFVPIMLGLVFFMFEFFEDKLLAFLVFMSLWACEVFAVVAARTLQTIRVFPVSALLCLTWLLVYVLAFPFGLHRLALACVLSALTTSGFHQWTACELPALQVGRLREECPREAAAVAPAQGLTADLVRRLRHGGAVLRAGVGLGGGAMPTADVMASLGAGDDEEEHVAAEQHLVAAPGEEAIVGGEEADEDEEEEEEEEEEATESGARQRTSAALQAVQSLLH